MIANKIIVSLIIITSMGSLPIEDIIEDQPNLSPIIEELSYQVVDYQKLPQLDVIAHSGCNCSVNIKISIDTYETGYYLLAQNYNRVISGRVNLSFPLLQFDHNNQKYDLVVRLWVGNSAIQNLIFTIQSATSNYRIVKQTNSSFQEITRMKIDKQGVVSSDYQSYNFSSVFEQSAQPVPTIHPDILYFDFHAAQEFNYQDAELVVESGFEGSDIVYREGAYHFPLRIVKRQNFYFFALAQNYYFDRTHGILRQTETDNSFPTDSLILSLSNHDVEYVYAQIIIHQAGINQSTYSLDLKFTFSKVLFGSCDKALVCIRQQTPLVNVVYTDKIQIRP